MSARKTTGIKLANALFASASFFCAAFLSLAQTCVTQPSGLVSWWAGENSANDEFGVNHGVLQNGVAFTIGEVNQAFSFDGTDDFVSIGASASLDVGSGNGFTIEFWMRPNDVTSQQCLVEWNNGSGGVGMHLWHSIGALGGLGSLFANVSDSSGNDHYIASSPNLLDTVNLQHVALTYDKTTGAAKIFHNGIVVASQNLGIFTPQTSYSLNLGARASGLSSGSCFNGLMDEVSLYSRVLSDAEIQNVFVAGTAGKCRDEPPTIFNQPVSRTVFPGINVTMNVGATGSALTYQWRFNNADIADATNSSLFLGNVQTNQSGNYSVIVSNAFGVLASSNAILTVDSYCVSAAGGLVSWWSADGNAIDKISGNDGALQGGLAFIAGKVGQAFSFDGTNDYINLTTSTYSDIGAGDGFTIECWIKPGNITAGHALAEWNNGSGIGVQFWTSVPGLGGNGSLFANIVETNGNNHIFASPAGILNITNFQHVAVTYNRTNGVAKIYRNGIAVASQTIGTFRPQTIYPLYFGKRVSGATPSFYQGGLDEVALYRQALTDADILSIYNADTNGKVCTPPEIVVQPLNKTVTAGSNATFSATVRGTATLAFQWRRNGSVLTGATNLSLTLSNVQPVNAGNYSLRVTNALGFAVSSDAALKVVVITATGNGQPLTNSVHSFNTNVTIQLQSAYTNGLIFYTLDGSSPSFLSEQYTAPFMVSSNVLLRAIGYSADFFNAGESDPVNIQIPPSYVLTVYSAGGGSVSNFPSTVTYISNTVVTVTAMPSAGWVFMQWLGDATGNNPVTSVTMNRSKSVQPVFGTTLSTTAAGGGSVTSTPSGGIYPYGTVIRLSAVPQTGNYFALWGNAASGNVNPLNFTLTNANPSVSSLFAAVGGGQAALTVVPVGLGQVSVSPRANVYSTGASASITATPASGQTFTGWSGDASGGLNPLSITMNQNKLIYANFTKKPRLIGEMFREEGLRLTLTGDFAANYQLETSTNLEAWTALSVLTNTTGTAQSMDSAATNVPRRFYRARLLP